MSTVYPTMAGFAGYSGGEALLRPEDAWDSTHPLVVERPDLFTAPEAAKRPARTRKAKADTDA